MCIQPSIKLMFRYYKIFIFPKGRRQALIVFLLLSVILIKAEACRSTQFFDGTNCAPCSTAISNCRACSSSTICTVCASTHYLDSGACIICSSANVGCETCIGPDICSNCQAGYYPTGNSSSGYTCDLCNTTMPNCTQCSRGGWAGALQCTRCQFGFIPGYGAFSPDCHSCSSMVHNCAQCNMAQALNSVGVMCTKCEHPYVLKQKHCYYSCNITNCLLCKQSNLCQTCETNYTALNGQCVLCSFAMTNCQQCSNLTTCTACMPNTTCFLADILSNSSSMQNGTSGTNSTNNSSSPANPAQNNNRPNNTSLSGNSAQVIYVNSDSQSSSSTLITFAAGLVAGLVAGTIVIAIVVLIVKRVTAPSVGQKITVVNSALNASASEAKEIRIENMQESFNNVHSFEESPPNVSGSPPRKGGRQPSARMPLESKRKILKINEDILEDSYE